jgi:hypothetical protein
MFKELAPFLRQRAALLTVLHLEHDQIRVNVVPKKLKDGENEALTTALSVTCSRSCIRPRIKETKQQERPSRVATPFIARP